MLRFILIYIIFLCQIAFAQWNLISPSVGTDHNYTDVFFVNKDTGFVTGMVQGDGSILRTLDAGATWDTTRTFDVNGIYDEFPYSIMFPTKLVGYAIGGGNIYKTSDCGENWIVVDTTDIHSGTGGYMGPDIIFINQDTGFAGYADGGIGGYRTYDGGWTWTPDPILLGVRSFNYNNGTYSASHGGWAILDLPSLTWMSYDNNLFPPSVYTYVNAIYHNGRIIVIGDKMGGSSYGIYAYSDDMGISWTRMHMNPSSLTDITFMNDTLGHMCGGTWGTVRTYDAGSSWHYTTVNDLGTGMYKTFRNFHFVDDTIGFAVSQNGIYKTPNGGGANDGEVAFFDYDLSIVSENESQFFVYPNPVQTEINFSNVETEISELIIYSLDGKEIQRKKIIDENKIDVSELATGNYILKVITETGVYSVQILKE